MAKTATEIEASTLGRRLSAARSRRGWSREALAYHSHLSWSGVAQIESGRRTNVRPSTLAVLADALGVTVDYLIGRDGHGRSMLEHQALPYATRAEFVDQTAALLAAGVERSEATLAVTTRSKIKSLRKQLGADAAKVTFAEASRWYATPSLALSRYRAFIDAQLELGCDWIRILGEPVWAGRSAAEVLLWTRYESFLNLEFAGLPVTVICPYDSAGLDPEILAKARATHQHTYVHGVVTASADYRPPSEFALAP